MGGASLASCFELWGTVWYDWCGFGGAAGSNQRCVCWLLLYVMYQRPGELQAAELCRQCLEEKAKLKACNFAG